MDKDLPNYDKIESIKNISVPNLDFKVEKNINIHEENIRSITKCEKYIFSIYEIFYNIFRELIDFESEMHSLLNIINSTEIDDILIEKFNKNIDFFLTNINSYLMTPIVINNIEYVYPIKKVDKEKKFYSQSIDLFYVLDGPQFFNKHLGEVSNLSLFSINEQNFFIRGEYEYSFNKIKLSSKIEKNNFIKFIEEYISNIKKLRGWIYNDLMFTNSLFKSLKNIINDIDIRSNYIDDDNNKPWEIFKNDIEKNIKNYLEKLNNIKY